MGKNNKSGGYFCSRVIIHAHLFARHFAGINSFGAHCAEEQASPKGCFAWMRISPLILLTSFVLTHSELQGRLQTATVTHSSGFSQ